MPREVSRQLSRRVQEFELWKDDQDVFKDVEYARRRAERRRELKKLESDERLRFWKKVYVPSLLAILSSTIALLCSSISSLGQNSFFFAYRDIIYIVAPVVLVAGVIGLMLAAAFSYKEEERLRIELGLPSQFPQPRSLSKNAMKSEKRSLTTAEFNDIVTRRKKRKMWRKVSSDSLETSNFLESSTSSANTELTWLQHSGSSSSSRPITLEAAEARIFEKCEEEDDYERVVEIHISTSTSAAATSHLTLLHPGPRTSKATSESTDCFTSENSSGYSTVAGSEPDNTDGSKTVVVEIPEEILNLNSEVGEVHET